MSTQALPPRARNRRDLRRYASPGGFVPSRGTEEDGSLAESGVAISREYYCDWFLLVNWKSRRRDLPEKVSNLLS
jgi:hypothetical protein